MQVAQHAPKAIERRSGTFPKAANLTGKPNIDSIVENPWQLEFPDHEQVGSILYYSQPRRWLRLDKKGRLAYETIDRQDLVHELNISYRDVRILDPLVATPYPTALLIREKALVVNMEAVRMIICADQCYVLSVPNASSPGTTGVFPASDNSFVKDLIGLIRREPEMPSYSRASSRFDERLPYELRALEAALQATARTLAAEVDDMEARTEPCLRTLLQKISEIQLEQLRILKNSLNGLTDRVAKVRTELEETLDDDQDMLDMYLGKRAKQKLQAARDSGSSLQLDGADSTSAPSQQSRSDVAAPSVFEGGRGEEDQICPVHPPPPAQAAVSAAEGTPPSAASPHKVQTLPRPPQGGFSAVNKKEHTASHHLSALLARLAIMKDGGSLSDETLSIDDVAAAGLYAIARESESKAHTPPHPRDISECEGLLEVYYKQMDELSRRLAATKARIAGTEASIEVLLDQRRNGLTALTLVVNSVMLGFAFVSAVVGGFGMNFATWMSDQDSYTSKRNFWITLGLASGIGLAFFVGVMVYARFKRLLFTPDVLT